MRLYLIPLILVFMTVFWSGCTTTKDAQDFEVDDIESAAVSDPDLRSIPSLQEDYELTVRQQFDSLYSNYFDPDSIEINSEFQTSLFNALNTALINSQDSSTLVIPFDSVKVDSVTCGQTHCAIFPNIYPDSLEVIPDSFARIIAGQLLSDVLLEEELIACGHVSSPYLFTQPSEENENPLLYSIVIPILQPISTSSGAAMVCPAWIAAVPPTPSGNDIIIRYSGLYCQVKIPNRVDTPHLGNGIIYEKGKKIYCPINYIMGTVPITDSHRHNTSTSPTSYHSRNHLLPFQRRTEKVERRRIKRKKLKSTYLLHDIPYYNY